LQNQRQRFRTALVAVLTISALVLSLNPASASRNGIERKNNTFSVGITFKLSGIDQVCSAALLAPTLLATAAHCLYDESGAMGTNYYFTKPGVPLDAAIDPAAKLIKISKIYTQPGYVVNAANQKDDIAFVVLDAPLATSGFIRLATASEVAGLTDGQPLKGYGFGHVYETNAGYSVYAREYAVNWKKPSVNPPTTIELYSTTATACSGDSGGAITTTSAAGEEILVGVMSGAANVANACGTAGSDGRFIMQATVVDSYKALMPVIAAPVAAKRYKITCVKGKVKKFVTGTKPKCPAGYKQTAKVLVK
jgi:secreted trypsin-like serine protease